MAGSVSPVGEFLGDIDWAMPARTLEPKSLACLSQMGRLAEMVAPAERRAVELLASCADVLHWGQTYTAADFGQHFLDNYGWVELFGTRGHYMNEKVAAGFLVLGPGIEYPDHHHVAEEVYIPLTGGTEWRMGDTPFRERRGGEVIHHASNMNHAMHTGSEPLLALYLWRGGPLAAKSTVTGTVTDGRG
ncbi:dimethylsulfoniopropionate lyase DddQ [Aminobacter sp. AP02]|nr:dimethylsulfoniopropionate lyase DddQ [Aminobacter sp. AP02]